VLLFLPLGLLQSLLLILFALFVEHNAERRECRTIRTITIENGTQPCVASD
jgi:hypothetical protein